MAIAPFNKDMDIIQQLDDEPNDVGGLTAQELKEKFDEGGNALKNYINQTLIPALEGLGVNAIIRTGSEGSLRYLRLNSDKVLESSADGAVWEATGSSGHIIVGQDGTQLPQRSRLQFVGCEVSDSAGATVVHGVTGPKGDKGDRGETGATGPAGPQGKTGPSVVPSVDANGVMSFSLQDTAILPQSVSVRGPQGPQGVQGAQGPAGAQGIQGIQGVAGAQGPKGDQGEPGPAGATGPAGPTGAKGEKGDKGDKGETGAQGPAGPTGATGPAGPQGPTGAQGPAGAAGKDGTSLYIEDIYSTLAALRNAIPAGNEKMYMVQEDGECYVWSENAGDWVSVGKLQGATGPQGPQGAQGVQGPSGTVSIGTVTTGPAGSAAAVTNSGTTENAVLNFTIPRGDKGEDGAKGEQGPQGEPGPQGETGPQGPQGIQGVQGEQGATGPQGPAGAQGPAGLAGKSAYQAAVESGYSGTETAFNGALASVPGHMADQNNPHKVEAEQIGAVPSTRTVNGKPLSGDITLTAADVGAAAVSHNHSAGDITSGTLSSARLPVVPISKGGTGKTTAAEALAALGGVSAASLAAYDKTIKGTYPIATGNSVTAGDVVDVVNGEVTRSVVAEANVKNVFATSNIAGTSICRLNDSVSVVAYAQNAQLTVGVLDNQTGTVTVTQNIVSDADKYVGVARLSDTKIVLSWSFNNQIYTRLATIVGNSISVKSIVQPTGNNSRYPCVMALDTDRFAIFYSPFGADGIDVNVGTVSGDTITYPSAGYSKSGCTPINISATLLPDDSSGNKRACVCFSDTNDNNKGKAVIATINSSNVVTWGSVVTFSDKIESVDVCTDGENSVVFYRDTTTGAGISRMKNLSITGTVITPSTVEYQTGITAFPQIQNMSGKFVVDGANNDLSKGIAYVVTKSDAGFVLSSPFVFNLDGSPPYLSMAAIDNNHVILAYADNGNRGYGTSTILEVSGNQIAGSFTVNSTQAIALESGEAGQEIEVIFAGTTAADFATEGQKIPSDGVYGYGPMAGWLNVIPYWAKEAGVRIATGSYVGTGTYGASNPCSLTFDFVPVLIFVYRNDAPNSYVNGSLLGRTVSAPSIITNGIGVTHTAVTLYNGRPEDPTHSSGFVIDSQITGSSVNWHSVKDPSIQLNESGIVYYYIAIG